MRFEVHSFPHGARAGLAAAALASLLMAAICLTLGVLIIVAPDVLAYLVGGGLAMVGAALLVASLSLWRLRRRLR